MKIILDTNFLIYCAKQKIDYKEKIHEMLNLSYELAVPSAVINELTELKMNAKKFSDRQAAELALKLLKHNKVKIVKTSGKADDEIIKLSKDNIIASLDREIRYQAERIITVSTGKKLRLIGRL